ncbi:hypothetical protein HS088_TW09G00387 [Tripterygium wilfordii]|uniref:Uncharacterized protein n=1 Tax=Tripterygium wilfordii TaxID=458696 RepID=A0A7J7D7P1_TRIWF|nr:uncharacterized protein LOC120005002 [Tripterygium wilfordii]KAF5742343.1 hypothetical protein HS088_TW09G00387 [Tripterygium wilfordii]
MKKTIRCCISCILPCGALDVIRIVHANGRVEEISGTIRASEIMKAHPKHVLKKPSSPSDDRVAPKIVIVPPDAQLQRGKIYFLMPVAPAPEKMTKSRSSRNKKGRENNGNSKKVNGSGGNNVIPLSNVVVSDDQYLSEILSEKQSTQKDRRRGRVGVWRPHLESICESPNGSFK